MRRTLTVALFFFVAAAALGARTPQQGPSLADVLAGFEFRNMGPFRAGAWITDFAVPAVPEKSHRQTFYVGTRNGGVWKTENNGTTFRPVFDSTGQQSIGAVAVAPSNERVVWVGTGESFIVRWSVSGNGVYKSTDGGTTWAHMGLAPTQHISRILIHPKNPDVVYVASMGPLHTASPARGVYRTRDGGATWERVLFVNDGVGIIEMVMDPADPDVLYTAAYDKERFAWKLRQGGPGSGIYKTTNGGTTWARLEGGLPTGNIGRIGLDVFRGNSRILYALVENLNPRPAGLPQPNAVGGGIGEVYRSEDGGATWRLTHDRAINVGGKAPYSFNWIKVDPKNDQKIWVTSVWVAHSADGGKTWADLENNRTLFRNMFGDIRVIWVDPEDPDRLLVGSDGGVYQTLDGGRSVKHYANLPLGEVYAVAVDMDNPYHIHAGLQDHESWRAPVNGFSGRVGQEHWVTVGEGDGMYNAVDPTDSAWVYNTQQFGLHFRQNLRTGERTSIAPSTSSGQAPSTGSGQAPSTGAGAGEPRLRYTWIAPLILSPHDAKTLIAGAHKVLRSRDQGTTWQAISGDLTTAQGAATEQPGSPCTITRVGEGNVWYCAITTVAESAHTRGVIWAATDDGRIHVTRDDGGTWSDVTRGIEAAGAPRGYWFTRVTASRHDAGTAFATVTGFHRDDLRPFVFVTEDFGATWRRLTATLPTNAPANVIVEDARNASLLFLGTDRGLFASIDRGASWTPFQANMPIVPVKDLVIHPREHDLIVGTHGRGIWVTDVSLLQETTPEVVAKPRHLFAPEAKGLRIESGWGNYPMSGDDVLATPNEPNGMTIAVWQGPGAAGPATVRVTNEAGQVVFSQAVPAGVGLRRVLWPLRVAPAGGAAGGRGGRGGGAPAPAGRYTVTLEAGSDTQTRSATVLPPVTPPRISGVRPLP